MKNLISNIVLIALCCSVGIGGGVFIGNYVNNKAEDSQPEGSQFESVDDLRKQITERDERDNKSNQSVSFRTIIKPNESDSIIYELAPNLDVKFQQVSTKTNSHGMRNREVEFEKPENVYRIALLGDSFAFGWGVEEDKIFARVIERQLSKKTGKKIEVLNFGVPGYSTFQEVEKFRIHGSKFKPDAVLVYFVDNDFFLPFFIKNFDDKEGLGTASDFNKFRHSKDDKIRNESRRWLDTIDANRSLVKLSKMSEEQNFELFLTVNPRNKIQKDLDRLWALRENHNIKYLDLRAPFVKYVKENKLDPKNLQLPKDPHPNAKKHKIFGDILSQAIIKKSKTL